MIPKYWPTVALCLLVWMTVIVARTDEGNPWTYERVFAITVCSICWFTIGSAVERIRAERRKPH